MKNYNIKLKIFLISIFLFLALGLSLLIPPLAEAHCPLCVAGAAVGVSLTRYFGIDDSITGVWVAALLGSMSFWFYSWLLIRVPLVKKYGPVLKPLIYIFIWGSTLWSFYQFHLVIRMSQVFGLDKLTFGMMAGGVLFYLVDMLKLKHYFNYQKIVISLGSMIVLSLLIYILINFYI